MNKVGLEIESENQLQENIIEVIQDIDSLSFWLAQKVDDLYPNDIFWIDKYEHCKKLQLQTESIGKKLDLNTEETLLLSVVFKWHDIWRHQEVLNRMNTLRIGIRHGILWVKILSEANILKCLSSEHKTAILSAIEYHSEKIVNLDSKSLWYKLCYILRDFDKSEIIEDKKYLEINWIFEQINKHYFSWTLLKKHKIIISDLFNWNEVNINSDDKDSIKLKSIMTDWINLISLEEFIKQGTTTVQDIKYSYSTYMLNSVSMLFDIKNKSILKWFIQSEMFKKRLEFIQLRVTPEIFKKIVNTISDYLKLTFWNDDIDTIIEWYNSKIINLIK
jgi:hypothetical protein